MGRVIADLGFQRWILDDTNLGHAGAMVSRVHVLLISDGEEAACHVDLSQEVGADYASGEITMLAPRLCAKRPVRGEGQRPVAARRPECIGDGEPYGGPLNVPAFDARIVAWFRARVSDLRAKGRVDPAPRRMPDMEFFGRAEDRFEID